MKQTRRILALAAAGVMTLFLTACGGSTVSSSGSIENNAGADEDSSGFPDKAIQIIVPFGTGGGADISVRTLAKYAVEPLGQEIEILNVTGGSGTVGLEQLAGSEPDGYTLGYFACTNSNDSLLFDGIQYGVESFVPVVEYSADPHIIVASKKSGITDMEGLVATAKERPGELSLALGGAWTSHDFLRISLEEKESIKFKRMVYQGGAEAIAAVASGDVELAFPFVSEAISQIETGSVTPIAITSKTRFDVVPDIPTIKEQGIDYVHTMWRGLAAPAGTPQGIVDKIATAFETAWNNPDYQAEAKEAGTMTEFKKGREFTQLYLTNHETYKNMIEAGID